MLFDSREDLVEGTKLIIMDHFARFGLEMYVRHRNKESKTDCVLFLAFDKEYNSADSSKFDVNNGYVQFTR
jgi:hypothetical protein